MTKKLMQRRKNTKKTYNKQKEKKTEEIRV